MAAAERFSIGCGSGLSTLAALRVGAASVKGVDYDADSAAAARTSLTAQAQGGSWSAVQRSVFDPNPRYDRSYDTVRSWGVLHYTSVVWRAAARREWWCEVAKSRCKSRRRMVYRDQSQPACLGRA